MAIRNRPGFVLPKAVPPTVDWFGHMAVHRVDVIGHFIMKYGWTRGAELGLWEGRTTARLLAAHPNLEMIGVDLWAPQPWNDGPEDYVEWDHEEHAAEARKRLKPFGDRVTIYRSTTLAAAREVPHNWLDFVFFDADHGEEALRCDIMTWRTKVKPSGWLIGHDINWPSVRAAVDDLVPGYEIGPDVTWFRPLGGWH